MPIVTRTVAKGIAPRVRSPGLGNAKKRATKDTTQLAQHHHKRKGGDSDESVNESDDEDFKHVKKRKRHAKWQHREPSTSDVEVILSDTEREALSEEVVDEPNPGDSDKVCRKPLTKKKALTHTMLGGWA
jgi:hypothetical protein